jgi:glucose-6-phosphate-specific signal transduction histidine kinase
VTDTDALLVLNKLRKILDELFQPEVMNKFMDLKEALGDDHGMVSRYDWFLHNSEEKENCRYTRMAKEIFLAEQGDNIVELIRWLHDNWARKV